MDEIALQLRGSSALTDPEVAEKIGVSDSDMEKLKEVQREAQDAMREKLFAGGHRVVVKNLWKGSRQDAKS